MLIGPVERTSSTNNQYARQQPNNDSPSGVASTGSCCFPAARSEADCYLRCVRFSPSSASFLFRLTVFVAAPPSPLLLSDFDMVGTDEATATRILVGLLDEHPVIRITK